MSTPVPETAGATAVPVVCSARPAWWSLPPGVRNAAEILLGSRVSTAATQPGGFSRGVAARLGCAYGERAFIKAVSRDGDPYSVTLYEREASIAPLLPPGLHAPAFLGRVDTDGWLALLFADAPGTPPAVPWRQRDLELVLPALAELTDRATPCPVPQAPPWGDELAGWRNWSALLATGDPLTDLPSWTRRRTARLAELEAGLPEAIAGNTLLHSDLRSDNMILGSGNVTFVDWAWAARGRDWLDPLIFALCAAVQGHPDPEELFQAHPAARTAEPEAVASVLAALAGRFTVHSRIPATWDTGPVRAFQRAETAAALRWLAGRTGIDA